MWVFSSVISETAFRSRSFSFSSSLSRLTWSVFRPPNSLRQRESRERRHSNRPHRLGYRLTLRHQDIDLPELGYDLLRLVLLLGHPSSSNRLESLHQGGPLFRRQATY